MCCYRSRRPGTGDRRPKTDGRCPSYVFSLSFFRDDRGVAMLEGIIVFAMLAGVLLGCMLLGQWGTHRQYAQMGARLRTFDAGTDSVARFQRLSDQTSQTLSRDSVTWGTYFSSSPVPVNWLDVFFVLHNDRLSGSRRGTQRGRLPSQGRSMFDFSPASVGYHSDASAATNSWADTAENVQLTFLGIAYWAAYNEATPETLTTKPVIQASGLPILDTIYARVGVPLNP
jgi:hypothetical protein